MRRAAVHSLEEVGAVLEAEEGHRVSHHPDVAAAAVVVRLTPEAVSEGDLLDDLLRSLSAGVGHHRVGLVVWEAEKCVRCDTVQSALQDVKGQTTGYRCLKLIAGASEADVVF